MQPVHVRALMVLFATWPALLCARPRPVAPPPLSATAQHATELTEQAYELQRRGALNDAISLYAEALRVDPLPKRHRNLAIPLEQAGRLVEALVQYWKFQRDERGEPEQNQRDVAERVSALLLRLGHLQIAPLPSDGQVKAVVRVPLALTGRPRCAPAEVPDQYFCEPGPVEAELLLSGRPVAVRRVVVQAGRVEVVRFTLRGDARISANRARPSLLLDGAPLTPPRLPATLSLLLGSHELYGRDGREQVQRSFQVREGSLAQVELRFSPRRIWRWFVIGAAVLAAAGIAAGAGGYAATRPAPPGGADISLPPPM